MRYILVFVVPVLLSLPAFAQEDTAQCTQFKTGNFVYRDDSLNAVLIKRKANRQEEAVTKTGVITKFKIKWITDCSYEIKQVWSNSKARRKGNGSRTIVFITKTGKDFYEYSCACKDLENSKKNHGIAYRVP